MPQAPPPRSTERRRPRTCEVCEVEYRPTHGGQRTCGRVCGVALRRRIHGHASRLPRTRWPCSRVYFPVCIECGQRFTTRCSTIRRCGAACKYEHHKRQVCAQIKARYRTDPAFRDQVLAASHARRARRLGLGSTEVLLAYLAKRDRGVCGICHTPVRAKRGPMRPSIDHIVPLSRGGTHDLVNVQLSHYRCNEAKGNRGGGEQLLLVG